MYKGLWVVADKNDLSIFKASLPALLPDSRAISVILEPTVLFLQRDEKADFPKPVQDEFLHWSRNMLKQQGFKDGHIQISLKNISEAPDKEVHDVIEQGQHGVIIIGHNKAQAWRERVLYKERGKVVALIGPSDRQNEILVPVDLSSTTLLILRFVCHSFVGKPGYNLNFVHVFSGSPDAAEQRWEGLKDIVGWDEDFPLQLIPSQKDVAAQLLDKVRENNCGTVIMGKRGLTGMKRWLLGSVSSGVLRGLTDESIFLID